MNHYPLHIGDYITATVGLSMLEDCCYSRLLNQYYATEKPLPLDMSEVYRMARALSPDERQAADYVVNKFFDKREDGYHKDRVDDELAAYRERADQARTNGRRGGRKASNDQTGLEPDGLPDGLQSANRIETGIKANQEPVTSNQEPRTKNQTKSKPSASPPLPDWLDSQIFEKFRDHRIALKSRMTPHAEELIFKEIGKFRERGHDPTALIEQSISNGWKGIFELKGAAQNGTRANVDDQRAAVRNAMYGTRPAERVINGEATRVD